VLPMHQAQSLYCLPTAFQLIATKIPARFPKSQARRDLVVESGFSGLAMHQALSLSPTMRTTREIRRYFVDMLNHALPRLGMYGGEIAARHFLSHLAFVECREDELATHYEALQKRGAFLATGVKGAFRQIHDGNSDQEVGSVYAEIAFQMGYLATDRLLNRREFKSLRIGLRKTCRTRDFTTKEVQQEFGPPSWSSGTNPFYPWVFLYITDEPSFGAVAFDFWNEVYHDFETEKTCGKFGNLPVLRNVRIRGAQFVREIAFTPLGRRICNRN
jgi:hypothetical protein